MPEWTTAQQEAIASRNSQVLVSAAAGSGKTSVLIERIMSMLREGMQLDRMLVVTFTQAAAAEMKERLGRALALEAVNDRHLREQRAALNRSDIGTLHSVCKKIIARHFEVAQVDPEVRVGDEGRVKALFDRAVEDEMEKLYQAPGEDGQRLIDQYKDFQVEQMLRDLYRFLMAQESPWDWLAEKCVLPDKHSLRDHPWYQDALSEALLACGAARKLIEDNLRLCALPGGPARYLNNCQADQALVLSLEEGLRARLPLALAEGWGFARLSTARAGQREDPALSDRVKQQRNEAKALLNQALNSLPLSDEALEKAADDLAFTAPALRSLADLTRRCHAAYGALKEDRQMLDFADLEHLALRCLMHEPTQRELAAQYDALFVDEYQDISRIQDAIIRRLQGEKATLFMVGDVKQSIYRFREAAPDLFMEKYGRFVPRLEAPLRLIHLSHNYRSRRNILEGVNHVFFETLREGALEIDYDLEAALQPGLETEDDPACELHLILKGLESADEEPEAAEGEPEAQATEEGEEAGELAGGDEREALIIAGRIQSLLGSPIREGEQVRGLRYRDMVILLRSASGRARKMAEVLKQSGIPVYSDADQQYFDLQEVSDALNLLHIIDNPLQDELLLAALRSPAFSFDELDLLKLRQEAGPGNTPLHESFFALEGRDAKITRAIADLRRWRFLSLHTPLDAFIRMLIKESGLYAQAGAKPQGALRRANLRLLCERAAPDPEPQTLQGFLSRVKEARRQEQSRAASTLGAGEDVVRILTIHKSKGLEFPVVFLPCLSREFRLHGANELMMLDAQSGIALRKVDPDKRMAYATIGGKAILSKKLRQIRSEEARLLYVAMTRARERLILLAAPAGLASARKAWARPAGALRSLQARSMMDWIGASLWPILQHGQEGIFAAENGSCWQIFQHAAESLRLPGEQFAGAAPKLPDQPPSEAMRRRMAGLPLPQAHPLKLSVTQLSHRLQEELEETPAIKRIPMEEGLPPLIRERSAERAVNRGAATHKALSAVPLAPLRGLRGDALRQTLAAELERLTEQGILLPTQHRLVDIPCIAGFFESALGQRLLRAERLEREWPFSLMVEQGLLLQGVLDSCFVEEGAWVLIDYKTDRAGAAEITRRYAEQMRWYMRALRDISGLPVREAWLYALSLNEAFPVEEDAPIRYQGLPEMRRA